jgi:alanine dehydrogenase
MIIGIPKEIKVKESRVSCTPGSARMLVRLCGDHAPDDTG